ncbi:hypothetical protein [Sorangium sp. So ce1151]|uniref:hypothetical protein n=1 Tax=Sorangium sp. So ce1151 TaxID=3133332 RepID=UPI003F6440EB
MSSDRRWSPLLLAAALTLSCGSEKALSPTAPARCEGISTIAAGAQGTPERLVFAAGVANAERLATRPADEALRVFDACVAPTIPEDR